MKGGGSDLKQASNRSKRIANLTSLPSLTLILLFLYLPIGTLIIFSFNNSRIISPWKGFTFTYFALLFQSREILMTLRNTLILAAVSTSGSVLLGLLTALALENKAFTGRKVLWPLILIPLLLPDILMGVSLALFFNSMRIKTGFRTVLIAHITFCLSYTIMVIRAQLEHFDYSLEEAGMDLGANRWQVFLRIKLPLLKPGILAAALLAFTLSIDDFIITFFTTGRGFSTLPIYIEGAIRRGITTTLNALSAFMVGFTLFLVVISKRIRTLIHH